MSLAGHWDTVNGEILSYDCRAFAIAGPSAWNSLPDPVRNPYATEAAFRRLLKTLLFAHGTSAASALRGRIHW